MDERSEDRADALDEARLGLEKALRSLRALRRSARGGWSPELAEALEAAERALAHAEAEVERAATAAADSPD